jgi:lactonase
MLNIIKAGASKAVPIVIAVLSCVAMNIYAQGHTAALALRYDSQTLGPVPVPPSERNLQTVVAEPWFKVSDKRMILEGPAFDRDGNLLFCDVSESRVLRLTPEKRLSVVVSEKQVSPGGIAIHEDGRIFIAALNLVERTGDIIAVKPDGTDRQTIVRLDAGYMPNDLVFDRNGGLYFSDFRGTSTDPAGGVYYVSPDGKTTTPVLPHLAMANGVALSPNGKVLWATESGRNLLHRIELLSATAIAPVGSAIPYHFIGPLPDSMRVDSDGNVYVAMYGQGRVLAFNPNGIPIGQVLLPGRDDGHNLESTNMVIRPGTNDLYIVTTDAESGEGATIFHAKTFANALTLYSHQ